MNANRMTGSGRLAAPGIRRITAAPFVVWAIVGLLFTLFHAGSMLLVGFSETGIAHVLTNSLFAIAGYTGARMAAAGHRLTLPIAGGIVLLGIAYAFIGNGFDLLIAASGGVLVVALLLASIFGG